jgi:hypothetical protein
MFHFNPKQLLNIISKKPLEIDGTFWVLGIHDACSGKPNLT